MTQTRRPGGLGRGLGALIPPAPTEDAADAASPWDEPADAGAAETSVTTAPGLVDVTDRRPVDEVYFRRPGIWPELGGAPQGGPGEQPVAGAVFAEVPVTAVRPNPRQPRTAFDEEAMAELVASMREVGLLQPIVVRPVPVPDAARPEAGSHARVEYELVMGERRWRAAQQAGFDTIPAIVRTVEDVDLLRDALLENLHRAELNPLEEAAAYDQLLQDFGCTHDELAQRLGRSRPQISNTLRLLRLPAPVQRRVAAGVLSAGHARALLGLEDGDEQERLAHRVVAEGLSVRAVEEIVTLAAPGPAGTAGPGGRGVPRPRSRAAVPAEVADLVEGLADRLDTRVRVDVGRHRGRLTIEFASVDDLRRIVALLDGDDV